MYENTGDHEMGLLNVEAIKKMKELEDEFSETGYEKFRTAMPWTPQNMTRNRWSNDFVVATTDKTHKSDPRFKVFAFSD